MSIVLEKLSLHWKLAVAEKWFHLWGAILRRSNYERTLYPLHYRANKNLMVFCSYYFFNRTNWAFVNVSLEISFFSRFLIFFPRWGNCLEITKQNLWKAFSRYKEISLVLKKVRKWILLKTDQDFEKLGSRVVVTQFPMI